MSYGTEIASHLPCPSCDSSDAFAVYQSSEDGERFYGICYSSGCSVRFTKQESDEYIKTNNGKVKSALATNLVDAIPAFKVPTKAIRGILPDVLRRYAVRISGENEGGSIPDAIHFPLWGDDEYGDQPIAQKTRLSNKHFAWTKTTLEAARDSGFFGQKADWRPSKSVMITEGELDAMSAYQMLRETKWNMPVVSLKNGAKDTKLNKYQKEFLDKFTTIYICFDNDEQGRKAAKNFSQSFSPDRIKLVNIEGVKDANDYLTKKRMKEFQYAVSIAQPIIRQGMILGKSTLAYLTEEPEELIPYPYADLNKMLYGMSDSGELITILSGSGLGKSTMIKHLGIHLKNTLPKNTEMNKIGCLFLEEHKKKTIKILTGMNMERNLVLPHILEDTKEEDLIRSWKEVFDSEEDDRWILWDHWGSNTVDSLIDTMRYMVANCGCKVILFDHISILLSGGTHGGDERKTIDELMTKLRTLINELEFVCIAISHLTKGGDSTPHEEGGRVKLSHARGAGSIYQLSDTVLGLERNGQADNEIERNITSLRVLKSRLSGETGPAGRLMWDKDKGILRELTEEQYENISMATDLLEAQMILDGVKE